MRYGTIGLLALAATLTLSATSRAQTSRSLTVDANAAAPAPPVESGIYGFSGGRAPGADFPEGVIGECIWIFDQLNHRQVAKGECSEHNPGKFRVVLKPGRYVVRGPGGNQPIALKLGQWIKIESITLLPGGF
jgi:hypothetical protein